MSNTALDDLDPVSYLRSTMDPNVLLKELGFRFEGASAKGQEHWLKPAGHGIWHSVIVDKEKPTVNYRKVRIKGRGVLNKEFQVIGHWDVPVSEVRALMSKWRNEAIETVHALLDADIDAFDPRADLDRLMPNKCPECGSSNVSEADDEGLIDCFNCGLWFDPLHPANSPTIPGNYPADSASWSREHLQGGGDRLPESIEDEISDLKAYSMKHGLPPRVTITYSRTTPESAEQGDFSESGWEDEDGVLMELDKYDVEEDKTIADITAKYLRDEGAIKTSSSDFYPGAWYSTECRTINYHTGEYEERNFHLVGFTPEQEKEVWDKFHEPRRPIVWT